MIEQLLALGFAGALIVMGLAAMYRMDILFILDNPFDFFMELMFVAIVPAMLMVFVFARTRRLTPNQTLGWSLAITFKLALFHLLAQLCGLYTYSFGR